MVCVGTKVFQGMGEFSQNMKKKKFKKFCFLFGSKYLVFHKNPSGNKDEKETCNRSAFFFCWQNMQRVSAKNISGRMDFY